MSEGVLGSVTEVRPLQSANARHTGSAWMSGVRVSVGVSVSVFALPACPTGSAWVSGGSVCGECVVV